MGATAAASTATLELVASAAASAWSAAGLAGSLISRKLRLLDEGNQQQQPSSEPEDSNEDEHTAGGETEETWLRLEFQISNLCRGSEEIASWDATVGANRECFRQRFGQEANRGAFALPSSPPREADVTTAVAYFIRLTVRNACDGRRVLPAFVSDNYFSLVPGESTRVAMQFEHAAVEASACKFDTSSRAGAQKYCIEIQGWNVELMTISI
eukprot:TRINITY_DN79075_c0_g1_i1.p1 TRINITY_DN79075_c0_g1~~TRINITY_DN79075_c0_g1_i1.p1  ORF type:complete len:231 (-),score=39.02 TRINITY_DN79075_c0_g1_i1:32-667(-)